MKISSPTVSDLAPRINMVASCCAHASSDSTIQDSVTVVSGVVSGVVNVLVHVLLEGNTRMAGNISGELNLAVWQLSRLSAIS